MVNWKAAVVSENDPLRMAIECINSTGMLISLIVDSNNKLAGVLTDGDLRRSLLKGCTLDSPVRLAMNATPLVHKPGDNHTKTILRMRKLKLRYLPILDSEDRITGLEVLDLDADLILENYVVLMAGGMGDRLGELTSKTPKPMLNIGPKPILETIIESFISQGFRNFYISVNYLANVISDYFGDGSKWNANIQYLQEDTKLGTAGSLSMLPKQNGLPVVVMNGDLLTKVDFRRLLEYHETEGASGTMCVRQYELSVPFGVVDIGKNNDVCRIEEKPIRSFFVNAGIYILSPESLSLVPKSRYDMTELFSDLIEKKHVTRAFPVHEYWLDIGQRSDFQRALHEYPDRFGTTPKD